MIRSGILVVLLTTINPILTCPDGCLCPSENQAMCNDAGLWNIPLDLPKTLTFLSVSGNAIERIPVNLSQVYPNLNKLFLDKNKIQNIEPYTFQGLQGMDVLSLTGNPLKELPKLSFSKIKNITTLSLNNNAISRIGSLVFAGSENIQMLLLSGNPILSIDSSAFTGLSNVNFLQLPSGIQSIAVDAFNGLTSVGYLKLMGMKVPELAKNLFNGIDNVTVLTIQDSELGIVHAGCFEGVGHIETLQIIGNNLEQFSFFRFDEETVVNKLVFTNNTVNGVGSPVVWKGSSVQLASFTHNYFPCDCTLHWLNDSGVLVPDPEFLDRNFCENSESLASALSRNISVCQQPDTELVNSARINHSIYQLLAVTYVLLSCVFR